MSDEIGPVTIYSQWVNVSILRQPPTFPAYLTNVRVSAEPSSDVLRKQTLLVVKPPVNPRKNLLYRLRG